MAKIAGAPTHREGPRPLARYRLPFLPRALSAAPRTRRAEGGARARPPHAPTAMLSAVVLVKVWLLGNRRQGSPAVPPSAGLGRVVADALARGERSAPAPSKKEGGRLGGRTPPGPGSI